MIYVFSLWMEESFACKYDNNYMWVTSSFFFSLHALSSLFFIPYLKSSSAQIVKGGHWKHHRPQVFLRSFSILTQSNCMRTTSWNDAIDSTCRRYFSNRLTICWAIKQTSRGFDLTISSEEKWSRIKTSFTVILSETHAVYYLQPSPPPPTQSFLRYSCAGRKLPYSSNPYFATKT